MHWHVVVLAPDPGSRSRIDQPHLTNLLVHPGPAAGGDPGAVRAERHRTHRHFVVLAPDPGSGSRIDQPHLTNAVATAGGGDLGAVRAECHRVGVVMVL